jgi:hypothetical protein
MMNGRDIVSDNPGVGELGDGRFKITMVCEVIFIEVQIFAISDVRRIIERECVPKSWQDRSCELQCVLVVDFDPARVATDLLNSGD